MKVVEEAIDLRVGGEDMLAQEKKLSFAGLRGMVSARPTEAELGTRRGGEVRGNAPATDGVGWRLGRR
jgi:hypothetical protein